MWRAIGGIIHKKYLKPSGAFSDGFLVPFKTKENKGGFTNEKQKTN